MKRKMVALVLAGMIVATVATVLAWDKTDLDTETGAYGIAIAVVRANFSNGDIVASDHDHDGGWKPGYSPPSGWDKDVDHEYKIDYIWDYAYTKCWTYIYDDENHLQETVYAYAIVS